MLPDKSLFIEQKSVKNAKIQKFECDSLSNSNNMDKFLNKKLAIASVCIMQKTATLNYPRLFFQRPPKFFDVMTSGVFASRL